MSLTITIDPANVHQRFIVERDRMEREYAFNRLKLHLSGSSQLNYSSETSLRKQITKGQEEDLELEFALSNYSDASLRVSYNNGMLRIEPQWGRGEYDGLREIVRIKDKKNVVYDIPLTELRSRLPKVEAELVAMFKDLDRHVKGLTSKGKPVPNDFRTKSYRVNTYHQV